MIFQDGDEEVVATEEPATTEDVVEPVAEASDEPAPATE